MAIRNLFISAVLCFFCPYFVLAQSNYTLLNDATAIAGCHCYQLTADVGNQGGGLYQNNTINLNNSFDYKFQVFLGCNTAGADGICFILTNNITAIGSQGGGLGYSGLPGNSLATEFDTYQNSWDPPYNHIAIEYAGQVQHPNGTLAGPVPALPSSANIDDCTWHTAEISWNVTTQTYSVYLDGNLRLTYTGNIVANFFANNPVVNWGWSGSTGGDENTQQVCIQSAASFVGGTDYESCSKTIPFTDVSTSNVSTVQSWNWNFGDPASGASNTSTLQNPSHTFSATGTYTVTLIIKDVSGCLDTSIHTVTINAPITLSDALTEPLCNGGSNGSIDLTPSGGFGAAAGFGGYKYTWSNNSSVTGNDNTGITSGTYNVTCTDGVCSATASYYLAQPPALSATTSSTDATCGSNNGTVTIAISGGTPAYQNVTWDLTPGYTLGGLGAGTYVANFTDANGCSAALQYTATVVVLPCGYTVASSSTNVKCFGASTGSVTLTVTGTVGTANYSWTNASGTVVGTTATVNNLPAGTYTYHFTDSKPTTFTGTVVITQPGGAMAVTLATVNTTCSYLNNGSAVASVTANGTPNYSYVWSTAGLPNAATVTGLSPGSITVTVTDQNGCTGTATGSVSGQPPLNLTVNALPDSCYQTKTGKISVTVSGGTPSYTYLWSSGPTAIGDTVYSLPTGPYTVTVTDKNSCTATATGTINQPAQLTATITDNNVLCFGGATGNATVVPAGGNGGYTYLWSTTATTATASGLSDSTYYVTVTDAKLCVVLDSVKITQPLKYKASLVMDSETCNGLSNASITVTSTNGSSPYSYSLDGGAYQSSGTFSAIAAGTHSVTAKDANGCDSVISFTIYQPSVLTASITYTRNATCSGTCNGSILAAGSGGTAPYTYSKDGVTFSSVDSFTALCAAAYTITVKDAKGCTATATSTVTQPPVLALTLTSSTQPTCFGLSNGTIVVTGSGGTSPYQYDIDLGAPQATGTFSGLAAGLHIMGIGDANGCLDSIHILLGSPTKLIADTLSTVEPLCFGGANGAITLGVSGGTYPYSYAWPQAPAITDSLATGLAAGTYSAYITDAKGCKDTVKTVLGQPTRLSPVLTMDSETCNGLSNASITVTTTNGTPPYTYSLDAGTYQSSGTFSAIAAGVHTVTVKDANGCDSVISFTIYQPSVLTASITYTRNATCNGTCNGSILAAGSGGTAPYTYSKDGVTFSSVDSFTALCAAAYTITVKDAKGCTATATSTVTQPPVLALTLTSSTQPTCFGLSNGTIVVTGSGGTSPYQYDIDLGAPQATGTFSGLAAGLHIMGIGDANGCLDSIHILLGSPTKLIADTLSTVEPLCFGGANGAITLGVSGGTYPYSYAWPQAPAITDSLATGLAAGTYSAYITDAKGCKDTVKTVLGQPTRLSPVLTMDSETCNGLSNASITVTSTNGSSPYSYSLDGGAYQSSGTFSAIAAGTHSVTAKDANGCDSVISFTIYQPSVLTASITYTRNATCSGTCNGSILAAGSGGTAPYTYSKDGVTFSSVDSFTALCAAAYTITVKDAKGCTATATSTVTQPPVLALTLTSSTQPTCFGLSNGTIVVTGSGGTSPYQYDIDLGAPQATGTFSGLAAGLHIMGIGDANGCLDSIHILLGSPTKLIADTLSTVEPLCFGGANGAITLGVSGGTYPYSYAWPQAPAITDSLATGLAAGTYSAYITDAKGCKDTVTTILAQPTTIIPVIASISEVTCSGLNNGSVTITATGGTGALGYELDASGTFQASGTFSGLAAGPHTVTVQDANLCSSPITFTITQPQPLAATLAATVNALCFGVCDGSFIVTPSGGTSPYQYSTDGVTFLPSDTIGSLCANPSYTITVKDSNNCQTTLTGAITQPASVVVTPVDSVPPLCYDGSNASFDVLATGGSGTGYTYSVNGGSFQANGGHFTGVAPGQDTVVVKDGNGCSGVYIITVPNVTSTSSFTTTGINELCFGGSTGAAYVTVSGTVTPYTYLWRPTGATTDTLSNIPIGTYTVDVTDAHGCKVYGADSAVTITQPAQIHAVNVSTADSCFNGVDGCVAVTLSGGTGAFTSSWSNGSTLTSPCGLPAGTYTDTVTDANGCKYINGNIIVTQPTQIGIVLDSVTAVSCVGSGNGAIAITDTGGTPGYTYLWSQGATSDPLTSLSVGTYTVTVTDAHLCTAVGSFTVGIDSPLVLNATKSNVFCSPLNNGSITLSVTGGLPAYQYVWSNGAVTSALYGLSVGIDSVTVTDSRGCAVDTGFVITNDSSFRLAAIPDTQTIKEGDNIPLGLQLTFGAGDNYASITWTPAAGLSCTDCQAPTAAPFTTTQYQVSVTTDSGCVATAQVLVTVLPQHQLYVPNAFTPNNDGINDYWEAFGYKQTWVYVQAQVYDRWGEKIYESNDINFQWDGTYKGTLVQPGDYVYTFKVAFVDGYVISNKGTITVIR